MSKGRSWDNYINPRNTSPATLLWDTHPQELHFCTSLCWGQASSTWTLGRRSQATPTHSRYISMKPLYVTCCTFTSLCVLSMPFLCYPKELITIHLWHHPFQLAGLPEKFWVSISSFTPQNHSTSSNTAVWTWLDSHKTGDISVHWLPEDCAFSLATSVESASLFDIY